MTTEKEKDAEQLERRRDPGPTGTQYADDIENTRHKTILSMWLLAATSLLAVLSIVNTFVAADRAHDGDVQDRANQFENCVEVANTLRADFRMELRDIKERILIPVFADIRDTIPTGVESHDILNDAVVYMRDRIDGNVEKGIDSLEERIPDLDCEKRYPPLG